MSVEFNWRKLKQHPTPKYVQKAIDLTLNATILALVVGFMCGLVFAEATLGLSLPFIPISGMLSTLLGIWKIKVKPALERARQANGWTMELQRKTKEARWGCQQSRDWVRENGHMVYDEIFEEATHEQPLEGE